MSVIVPEEQAPILRSYIDLSKSYAAEGYNRLEYYSPFAASLISQSAEAVHSNTPEFVQSRINGASETLEVYVDAADDLLGAALQKTKQFPAMIEEVKANLTKEQILTLVTQMHIEVSVVPRLPETVVSSVTGLRAYLPSKNLDDLLLREKVHSIVSSVTSQPGVFVEYASGVATNVKETLDVDHDGSISVKDLADNIFGFLSPILPSGESMQYVMTTITDNGLVSTLHQQWQLQSSLSKASEVLKLYLSHVQDHVSPLTPYLTSLVASLSVVELPIELLKLTGAATGLTQGKEQVTQDARALFWALVDISFIMEAIKEDKKIEKQTAQGVDMLQDKEALENTQSWAKSYQNMDFS